MKLKRMAALAAALVTAAAALTQPVTAFAANKPYIALGADLNAEQRATVLNLLGVTEAELAEDTVVTVTNAEEYEYLDDYVSSSLIGSRSLSSCKVVVEPSGHGITVTTHNISYCTPSMYENALATAGMKNASVTVAGPTSISGTAALVGAMKAYSKIYGTVIDPQYLDGATDELVTTGDLAETLNDPQKAAELIAAIKQIVADKDITSEQDIYVIIENVSVEMGITLTEEQKQQIVDLMKKLAALDLDADALTEQAQAIYENLKSEGLDLGKYGITEEEVDGLWALLKKILEAILSIFGKK